MGWAGFGAIIATACCLLYRCPPSTWTFGPWASPPQSKSISHNLPTISKDDDDKAHSDPVNEIRSSMEDDNDGETSQDTPKATATATPAIEIPILNLEGSHADAKTKLSEKSEPSIPVEQLMPPRSAARTAPAPLSTPSASTSSLMAPPPPRPRTTQQQPQQGATPKAGQFLTPPRVKSSGPLRPPPSAAASLRVPPSGRLSSSTLAPAPPGAKPRNSSRQVILEPGHSPLDWAALTSNPNNNLRGANLPPTLIRVTPSMLKAMNGRKGRDAWTSYQGKVYNITPYLPFHPGGKGELLRGAGKDSAKLFAEVHPWVNWDGMLGECVVGILVSEHDNNAGSNSLDAMD